MCSSFKIKLEDLELRQGGGEAIEKTMLKEALFCNSSDPSSELPGSQNQRGNWNVIGLFPNKGTISISVHGKSHFL